MAGIVDTTIGYYRYLVDDLADKRTDDYMFACSPWRPIAIFLVYILLIKFILPNYMKNREAFKLDNLILFYNFTQIVANGYLLYKAVPLLRVMSPVCAPVDYSDSPESRMSLDLCHLYYILKVYDLLDTVFFILRKKERQVTFLHIYHHAMMVTFPWLAIRYVPGGHIIYVGVCNTLVHIVMYFYYAYSLWNSGSKKSVWWKKHITHLQLTQFTLLMIMAVTSFLNPYCTFPKVLIFLGIVQNVVLIYLFGTFYYKTYIVKSKTPTTDVKKVG